jgi:hypothetical protein
MILAIDQYGFKLLLPGIHPRKELIEKSGIPGKVFKIYVDSKEGEIKHIGYGIGSNWFTFYTCQEWQGVIK